MAIWNSISKNETSQSCMQELSHSDTGKQPLLTTQEQSFGEGVFSHSYLPCRDKRNRTLDPLVGTKEIGPWIHFVVQILYIALFLV